MNAIKVPCQAPKLGGSCRQQLFWLNSKTTGRPAPIDAEPTKDGNIVIDLEAKTYEIVNLVERREELSATGVEFHKNHFGTCVDAELFRRGKATRAS